jgi:hypothetical protein
MPHHISLAQAQRLVLTRGSLHRNRWKDREIARALGDSSLRRLQRNRYVLGTDWTDLWPESRHLLEVVAAVGEMRDGDAVLSHDSAAVLWGLPLYRHVPRAVHTTIPNGKHVPSRAGLRRHTDSLPEGDITTLDGYRVTTLERTVFDLARTLSVEAAVAAADAAMRRVAFVNSVYDEEAAEQWHERMLARGAHAIGVRGVRQVVEVISVADGRAESPAESVGRLQLIRLGFRRIRLQVVIPGPDGRVFRVDIEVEDADALLEIDGIGKYKDDALRSGRPVEEVVLDEKRREDWIRGMTQRRFVRAEEKHVATAEALAARLTAFGIRLPA